MVKDVPITWILIFLIIQGICHVLWYFFKSRNGLVDCHVTDVIAEGRTIRGQGDTPKLIPSRARNSIYRHDFVYCCNNAWNDLPFVIKNSIPSSFKSALKNYFFALLSMSSYRK
jgi:hypothetical protein